MKLEDQVCSRELSERLRDLAVKQDGYWSWVNNPTRDLGAKRDNWYLLETVSTYNFRDCRSSAFTVAELGEMLPVHVPIGIPGHPKTKANARLTVWKFGHLWQIAYNQESFARFEIGFSATTEADARAKMLIHLLANGLVSIEKGLVKP